MRLFSSAPAFVAVGALAWGCAVYDSNLVPSDDGLTSGGETSSTGGKNSNAEAGSTSSSAGKTTTSGGTLGSEGGDIATSTGGTMPSPGEGGDASNEAGTTQSMGGTLGVSGSGGVPSKAGTGGTATGGTATGGKGGTATGGNGGSGGSAPVVKCADHPISVKTKWIATASSSSLGTGVETDGLYNPPEHMTDGNYSKRWSSGKPQSGDEWIEIDFGATVNLTSLTLNPNNDTGDYPRAYAIRISSKSQDFTVAAKASAVGMPGSTVVTFPAIISGRYVTVRQTGMNVPPDTAWWTVAEVLATCTDP
jgi:hypothetical protein